MLFLRYWFYHASLPFGRAILNVFLFTLLSFHFGLFLWLPFFKKLYSSWFRKSESSGPDAYAQGSNNAVDFNGNSQCLCKSCS